MNLRILVYLLLVLAAFGLAGGIDLGEAERLTLENYVQENTHGR